MINVASNVKIFSNIFVEQNKNNVLVRYVKIFIVMRITKIRILLKLFFIILNAFVKEESRIPFEVL